VTQERHKHIVAVNLRRKAMKKLVSGLVVLVMFGVCASSYGYFLIYKVSSPVKGADDVAGTMLTIPLKAYLVLNINDTDDTIDDANLILYGKDSAKNKVYVELNISDDNEFLDGEVWEMGGCLFVDFWTYENLTSPFYFEGFMFGKLKEKDIGLVMPYEVAGSLKGAFMVWGDMLLDSNQDIAGTGNIKASLWSQATISVNFDGWAQEEIVDALIEILQGQGYSAATLP